jgi:hypothetical protein
MDNLIEFGKNTLIAVISRIIFIAYYEKSHNIEKKEPNEPK